MGVAEIKFVEAAIIVWGGDPAPYTKGFEQLVNVKIIEGKGIKYQVLNFRRGLKIVNVRCIPLSNVNYYQHGSYTSRKN